MQTEIGDPRAFQPASVLAGLGEFRNIELRDRPLNVARYNGQILQELADSTAAPSATEAARVADYYSLGIQGAMHPVKVFRQRSVGKIPLLHNNREVPHYGDVRSEGAGRPFYYTPMRKY